MYVCICMCVCMRAYIRVSKEFEEMLWDVVKVRTYKHDMIYINVYMYMYV